MQISARRTRSCTYCAGEIPRGAPVTRNGRAHRGCSEAHMLRRPARMRAPFPALGTLSIILVVLLGIFVATQVAAAGVVRAFGPEGAKRLGVDHAILHNPLASAATSIKIGWTCFGLHGTPPKPIVPGAPPGPNFNVALGGGCATATAQAYTEHVAVPAGIALGITTVITLLLAIAGAAVSSRRATLETERAPTVPKRDDPRFRLFLGRATGRLAALGHRSGIRRKTPVVLVGDDTAQNTIIWGGIGQGKAVDCNTPILTPVGYRRIGSIKSGDLVIGKNGRPTRVLRVFPQGRKAAYRVRFSDGVSTVCCDDHLWSVTVGDALATTLALRDLRVLRETSRAPLAIPLVDPIEFAARELPLDPWTYGYQLAHRGRPRSYALALSGARTERGALQHLESLTHENAAEPSSLGIDFDYLYADIPTRVSVLQGVLAATAAQSGHLSYTTSARELARDLAFLVQSLGGLAPLATSAPPGRRGAPTYTVRFELPLAIEPFCDPIKNASTSDRRQPQRYITGIDPVSERDMVCIAVDAPDHLFVLDGCVTTHNTTYVINRLVEQSLEQNCGALILDIKSDYGDTVRALAQRVGRDLTRIGIGGRPCNLLADLTPETAGSFIKSAIILCGNTGQSSAFWTNIAVALAESTLGLLEYFPERYSLGALNEAIFRDAHRRQLVLDAQRLIAHRQQIVDAGGPDAQMAQYELRSIGSYYHYISHTFNNFAENVRLGALSQLSQVLTIFERPEIRDAFCTAGPDVLSMKEVLDGEILLLDLPISVYGIPAKTIYAFIKLRFYNVIDRRRSEPTWNQDRPVAFICDEFQDVVTVTNGLGLGDQSFFDKSRSARCVALISTQGYSSLASVIGNDSLTRSVLQNFRQKIIMRTEDEPTIKYASYLLGKSEVEFDSTSENSSKGSTRTGTTRSSGLSSSIQVREQDVINAQMFRELDRGQALCILSIDGAAYDDVLTMPPCFIKLGKSAEKKPWFAGLLQALRLRPAA